MFVYLVKKQVNGFVFHVHEMKQNDIFFLCVIPYKQGGVDTPAHQYIMDELIKRGKIPEKFKGMTWNDPFVQRLYTFKSI